MNPYASFLGDRDPLSVIAATAQALADRSAGLSTEALNRAPAPGKWSFRQIVCHLADTEIAFGFRLRQALAEPNHVIQPFDQDRWAERYEAYDLPAALALFTTLRKWNLLLLQRVGEKELALPVSHPERGAMTFRTIVETMAGHDLNHLAQLEVVGRASARPTVA
uniref:DinB-like domain-containing protein n=1 Tax=Solibacter usitatus (strain Ellin6076) TaxID=234267 RepID=Q01XR5_SOLUE